MYIRREKRERERDLCLRDMYNHAYIHFICHALMCRWPRKGNFSEWHQPVSPSPPSHLRQLPSPEAKQLGMSKNRGTPKIRGVAVGGPLKTNNKGTLKNTRTSLEHYTRSPLGLALESGSNHTSAPGVGGGLSH